MNVSAMASSGTGLPSLRRNGSKTSKRRTVLLVGGGAINGKCDAIDSQERERSLGNQHLPARPTLEREVAGETAQSSTFRKTDENHGIFYHKAEPKAYRWAIMAMGLAFA